MHNLPGILPPSSAAPGSDADLHARVRAGWKGHVLRLRFCGVYLPEQILRDRPVVPGLLISENESGHWKASLYDQQGRHELLHGLQSATVRKRREDGSMLIEGAEWDEGYLQRWPQTWLAARTPQEAAQILQGMSGWLRARYTGRLHMP